uniref:Uncharacterized protein n=1 Tax=Anguilla anguilla TaxID=7936 RepID=A0A0E9SJN7_ANGAN
MGFVLRSRSLKASILMMVGYMVGYAHLFHVYQ